MNRVLALIITLGVLIVLAFSCLFVVDQRQYAVVFALGEIKRVINEPGLYMKLPSPLQDVRYFDKRTLTYDSDEIDRFITAEKINIQVDSFVKWRIADPRQFFVRQIWRYSLLPRLDPCPCPLATLRVGKKFDLHNAFCDC